MAKEAKFELAVVELREDVEDGGYFFHAGGDDVAGEGNIPYGSSQEMKALVSRAGNATI